jgi:hypothetical protein
MHDGIYRKVSKCWGKETFVSPSLALKVERRHRRKKGQMVVYRCQKCSGWHLGTPIRVVKRGNSNGKHRNGAQE